MKQTAFWRGKNRNQIC